MHTCNRVSNSLVGQTSQARFIKIQRVANHSQKHRHVVMNLKKGEVLPEFYGPDIPIDRADMKFGNTLIARFIGRMTLQGKKNQAEQIMYQVIANIAEQKEIDEEQAVELICQAIDTVAPSIQCRSVKVRGQSVQQPIRVLPYRGRGLAMRYMIQSCQLRVRKESRPMAACLTDELLDALENKGAAARKRDDMYRQAEANKVNMLV